MTVQIETQLNEIEDFCRRWKITELSLFGSVLRDDFGDDSDIDVLVSFRDDAEWSLWDFIDAQHELESLFGRTVDLVEKKSLSNPFRRHAILNNRRVVYVGCRGMRMVGRHCSTIDYRGESPLPSQ